MKKKIFVGITIAMSNLIVIALTAFLVSYCVGSVANLFMYSRTEIQVLSIVVGLLWVIIIAVNRAVEDAFTRELLPLMVVFFSALALLMNNMIKVKKLFLDMDIVLLMMVVTLICTLPRLIYRK